MSSEDTLTAPAAPGVIEHAGHRWAVGLMWMPATKAGTAAKEARQNAREDGFKADLYTTLTGGITPQFGLGWASMGHAIGMPAMAAAIRHLLNDNSITAFPLPDGRWWVVAVQSGALYLDGDKVFDSEDEARAFFSNELLTLGGWSRYAVPAHWGIEDVAPLPPLDDIEPEPTLKPVAGHVMARFGDPAFRKTVLRGGVAAVILVGAGWYGWSWWQAEQEAERQAALQAARERAAAAARASAEPKMQPWETAPLPSQWLTACRVGIADVARVMPAWDIASAGCSGDTARAEWKRGAGGTVHGILAHARNLDLAVSLDGVGDGAYAVEALVAVPPRGEQEALTGDAARALLADLFQKTGTAAQLGRPRRGGPETVTFETALPPIDWAQALDRVPGLVMQGITWTGEAWQVTAGLHTKG